MITETTSHNVTNVKMEVRQHKGFSVLRVTATDSAGNESRFAMFTDGETINIPSIQILPNAEQ